MIATAQNIWDFNIIWVGNVAFLRTKRSRRRKGDPDGHPTWDPIFSGKIWSVIFLFRITDDFEGGQIEQKRCNSSQSSLSNHVGQNPARVHCVITVVRKNFISVLEIQVLFFPQEVYMIHWRSELKGRLEIREVLILSLLYGIKWIIKRTVWHLRPCVFLRGSELKLKVPSSSRQRQTSIEWWYFRLRCFPSF